MAVKLFGVGIAALIRLKSIRSAVECWSLFSFIIGWRLDAFSSIPVENPLSDGCAWVSVCVCVCGCMYVHSNIIRIEWLIFSAISWHWWTYHCPSLYNDGVNLWWCGGPSVILPIRKEKCWMWKSKFGKKGFVVKTKKEYRGERGVV